MHRRSIGKTTGRGETPEFVHFSTDVLTKMTEAEAEDFIHQFVKQVKSFEESATTTDFSRLVEAGITLPAPDTLDDAAVTTKLWEVIDALAEIQTFLSFTDHLTDRELYSRLHERVLHEEQPDLDPSVGYSATVNMLDPEECDPVTLEPRVIKAKRDKHLPRGLV